MLRLTTDLQEAVSRALRCVAMGYERATFERTLRALEQQGHPSLQAAAAVARSRRRSSARGWWEAAAARPACDLVEARLAARPFARG